MQLRAAKISGITVLTLSFGLVVSGTSQEAMPRQMRLAQELVRIGKNDADLTGAIGRAIPASVDKRTREAIIRTFARHREDIFDDLAREYAVLFDENELRELLSFYSSPAGQKIIKNGPRLARAAQEIAIKYGQKIKREMK